MSRTLDQIYASLPKIACKGLCSDSCGPIDFTKEERARMESKFGHIGIVKKDLSCPALAYGQCMVYENRPLICRLWGMVQTMRCPHGCIPDRWVSDDEAHALMLEAGLGALTSETTGPIPIEERAKLWKQLGPVLGRQEYERRLMELQTK